MTKSAFTQSSQDTLSAEARTLKEALGAKVLGQDSAIETIAKTIASSTKPGVGKPQASLLLTGGVATGKTMTGCELAVALNRPLTVVHMGDYQYANDVYKLIGMPPGYEGHGLNSVLKTATRSPSVLLLNEIEKGCPSAISIARDIIVSGKATGIVGNEIRFDNTVVVVTSQRSPSEVVEMFCHDRELLQKINLNGYETLMHKVRTGTVFDATPEFQPLGADIIKKFVERELEQLSHSLQKRGYSSLEASPEALNALADKCRDARDVRYVVREEVSAKLAQSIIDKSLPVGNLYVTSKDGKIDICVKSGSGPELAPAIR